MTSEVSDSVRLGLGVSRRCTTEVGAGSVYLLDQFLVAEILANVLTSAISLVFHSDIVGLCYVVQHTGRFFVETDFPAWNFDVN